ncbi:glycosyltransferase [Legionella impletisoli]|uniref:Glycosyltransferase 2-like domain-containing protein n=1 Tax=Legionella impletisoli TaxID=343510 RepID=A0A917JNQ4_9GAMM|nr:glycosyltransferase [Legionella impletisoli]GGI77330.1 hypothetical protein GCM10007966_02560 [Legionella impletisoli]
MANEDETKQTISEESGVEHAEETPEDHNAETFHPSQFDAVFLLSLLDPRPFFIPFNSRRMVWWFALLSLVAGYVFLEHHYDASTVIHDVAFDNVLPLMIALTSYEPLMLLMNMAFAVYPDEELEQDEALYDVENPLEDETKPENYSRELQIAYRRNRELAILIPCHKSEKIIRETFISCLRHVPPSQIFIVDNGLEPEPTDETRAVIRNLSRGVRYVYYGNTGNKTLALLATATYILHRHPYDLRFALLIDDDVLVPARFRAKYTYFEDEAVHSIVYPIRAISELTSEKPLLIRLQDLEYQLSDLEMGFLDRTNSVQRPHGAASLWKIATLVDVLLKHNGVFKGDDVQMGLILQQMRFSGRSGILRQDMICCFETKAPGTILGPTPNLYTQRVRSWNEAAFLYFWTLHLKPLLTHWKRPPWSLLSIKNHQLYGNYIQLGHIIRIPVLVFLHKNPQFWLVNLSSSVIQGFLIAGFNYLKLPLERRLDWKTTVIYPFYSLLNMGFGTLGFLRALLISGPVAPHPKSIQKRIEKNQLILPNNAPSPVTPEHQEVSFHATQSLEMYSFFARNGLKVIEAGEVEAPSESLGL